MPELTWVGSENHLKGNCLYKAFYLGLGVIAAMKLLFYKQFITFSKLADVSTTGIFWNPKM